MTPSPTKPTTSKSSSTPTPGISRLPPPFPSVRLPNHPPYSPLPNFIYSSPPRLSVISSVHSDRLEEANLPSNNLVGTPASSLDWDNFQSTPEFSVRKIPIVSTISSSLEGVDWQLEDLDLSVESNISAVESFVTGKMSEMETEAGELLDTKIVVLCEITDNPVSNIRPGMEAMAEKDVSRILEMRTKFRLDALKFIKKV